MATVPNQRKITIHREKCERDFLQIKKENWYAANKDLEPYGLQLYLYLAGNREGFEFELSQEAAERDAGIKKTTFHKYVNVLIDKGYLVPRKEGSNVYDFYEIPTEDYRDASPESEQDCLLYEFDEENSIPDCEFLSLLDENDNSQDSLESSECSKEIYNNKDTFPHIKINKGEFNF